MVSKWVHIAGVGLVSRPWAKVSDASRLLKSPGANGRGIGKRGRMATRRRSVLKPTVATANPGLRAKRPKARSMRENQVLPRRGHANAVAMAIDVKPPSSSVSEKPFSEPEGK